MTARALARSQDDLSLSVRPLVPGARGAWIKGEVSWDALRRSPERFRPAAARWFAELYGIAAGMRAGAAFTAVSEWLPLDAVGSAHLWPHLAAAEAAGVAIVAAHPRQTVRMARHAAISAEVGDLADGVLRVAARLEIDGEAIDPRDARPLGSGGVYAFARERDPVPVVLAPVELPAALAALVGTDAVRVPAADRTEFVRDAYPGLAAGTRVVAAPGSTLPAAPGAALRVAVDFAPGHRVSYTLDWQRPGGATAPFAADAGESEGALADAARRAWAAASSLPFAASATLRDADAAVFSSAVLPALEALGGVSVRITGTRPAYRELTGDPSVRVTTVAGADPDWFELGVIVTIDGRAIPFGALFTALSRGRRRMMLADGAYFSLGHPALARLAELLEEAAALAEWETGPRIARSQITLWADFEDLAEQAEPAREWRGLVAGLRDAADVTPAPAPPGLRAELRPYQRAGFSWLWTLWQAGLGGILADDMGLGKTLQTLALIAAARAAGERRPFLVVAPTSVRGTWTSEAARFAPDLSVRAVEATARRRDTALARLAADADVVVTSYAVLRLDAAEFAATAWAGVILDEAQVVKNPRTKLHQAVAALPARVTLALTGTPLENSLTDLWALLSLTSPGLFPSARRFREEYVGPIEQAPDAATTELSTDAAARTRARRLDRLRRRIRPFVLRRTKELVAPDLPPRQEQDLRIELAPGHRAYYDTVLQRERQKVLGLLDDLDRNRFIVFRSLTLLRMLSLAPALVDPAAAHLGSAKLDALLEHLVEVIAEGHRALVFSQFTSFLALAAERLEAAGIRYASLDGSTVRRDEVLRRFREGDDPVFLLSLKAGGVGLTLVEADYVFVLDPWWNPAAEAQAVDRTHRIGQTRTVFVYRMLSAGTIEEKVAALQARKAGLFRAVLDEGDPFARSLDAGDIRGLLAD